MPTRREFIEQATLAVAGSLTAGRATFAAEPEKGSRLNFVILYSDDQGIGDVGCYGAQDLETPHLDRLATSGVRMTDWYSNAPVCSPSRAALLTGRYPVRAGVPGNVRSGKGAVGLKESETTLARLFKDAGYRTGAFGKWHLGSAPESVPNAQGFDEFFGFHSGCVDYYSHFFYWGERSGVVNFHDLWRDGTEVWENGRYMTDLITREAVRFIRENHHRSFFLYVPYNAPHYPMQAPKRYVDRFSELPRDRRFHAALIAAMDEGIGQILDCLKETGIRERTVVFFQSDNGATVENRAGLGGSNLPYRGAKATLFEGGIRVPAIWSCPGRIPSGVVSEGIGAAMDVLPTFAALAGLDLPRDRMIDGKDVLPMLRGEETSPHESLFWEFHHQRGVRQGRWKIILDTRKESEADPPFLVDLETDPGETTNLSSEQPETCRRLIQFIQAWTEELQTP